jgi:hypothetical protein
MEALGKTRWAISSLNTVRTAVEVEITNDVADRGPAGPYRLTVQGERTHQRRVNELTTPEPIPRGMDLACVLTASTAARLSAIASAQ